MKIPNGKFVSVFDAAVTRREAVPWHGTVGYRALLTIFFFCWSLCPGFAQQHDSLTFQNNIRSKRIPVRDSLIVDSFSVAQQSFSIKDIPGSSYSFDPELSLLKWHKKPVQDSVDISYRILPLSFFGRNRHKSMNLVDSAIAFPFYSLSETDSSREGYIQFSSIDYNGTYGRSLSVGNTQDVSLNSNFNLQLNGYILDSVRIEAALTDNNIPFQPEGNTQQLQEFDKIYVTFEKGAHKLTAGDYALEDPESYFMNFDKRVQGMMFQTTLPASGKVENKVGFSGSIAKGEFARNTFQGGEGNQGPYKLSGNNGETFFIVLAGAERVYIDGILMERGEDRDYIIDYNTSEITFMARQMITRDKRIQVEFEYQSRNYLNTLFYFYDELNIGKKWNLAFHAYSNQDARNQPYLQTLDDEQKRFLGSIGDNIDQAFYRVVKEDTFAANKILYRVTDTLVDNVLYDSVFVYTTDPEQAKYSLGFSFVGDHNGNYVISGGNTNGRSYSWVAPLNGRPQGNYEPVVLLITPKMQQMFTVSGSYQIDSFKKVGIELGASNYAPNLFSDLDKDKHWGLAGKANYEELRFLGKKDSLARSSWEWSNKLSYEFVQGDFREISPFRNIEFSRDWNLEQDVVPEDEHYATFQTKLKKRNRASLQYDLNWYQRGKDYKASRNVIQLLYDHNAIRGGATFNLMHSDDILRKSDFYRPSAFLEKTFTKISNITLGSRFQKEYNDFRFKATDSLLPNALSFDEISFYIRNEDAKKTSMSLSYALRQDDRAADKTFVRHSTGHTVDGTISLAQWNDQLFTLTGAYRRLIFRDSLLADNGTEDESVLGRLSYNGSLLNGLIVPHLMYELGSGQQQKQEYIYIEVPAGQGMYMWNDYNNDGVQQANEFELAVYADQKKYIRIITPTNEYVKVNYVMLNAAIQFSPDNLWLRKEKKNWQKFISRFADQLSVQMNNRALASAGMNTFNPFAINIADDNIITNLTTLNNTATFNQKSTVWGAEYDFAFNSGKSLLTYGLEGNAQLRHQLRLRWNFFKTWTLNVMAREGEKSYQSALPDGRTYEIQSKDIEPALTWIKPSLMRVTAAYKYDQRQNHMAYGGEKALIQSVNLDLRLSFPQAGTIQAKGTYAHIDFNGKDNTSLSFAMLDALQKGTNWLWFLNWERRISRGIEISLDYEGRKPGNTNVIHTGRMSIRALL